MTISDIHSDGRGDAVRLSANLTFESLPERNGLIWVEWPRQLAGWVLARVDPFAVLCLPLAGALGEPLRSDAPVSRRLWHNLNEVCGIYSVYFPQRFRRVPIEIPAEDRQPTTGLRSSFYSGGVDSLYSAVESDRRAKAGQSAPLDELWVIRGFDIRVHQVDLWRRTWDWIQRTATGLELPLVVVSTNVREFYDRVVPWDKLGFSAAMGGVAKCVSRRVTQVLVGSYTTYDRVIPHASTPLVDPHWSCEEQQLIHFSCLADRIDKLTVIGSRPELLDSLRVCNSVELVRNCGVCEKCLRTLAQLLLLGLQSNCHSIPLPKDMGAIARLTLPLDAAHGYVRAFWVDIQRHLGAIRQYPDLRRAVDRLLRRTSLRAAGTWARRAGRSVLRTVVGRRRCRRQADSLWHPPRAVETGRSGHE